MHILAFFNVILRIHFTDFRRIYQKLRKLNIDYSIKLVDHNNHIYLEILIYCNLSVDNFNLNYLLTVI